MNPAKVVIHKVKSYSREKKGDGCRYSLGFTPFKTNEKSPSPTLAGDRLSISPHQGFQVRQL